MVIFPGCSQNKKTVVYLCACVLTPSLSAVSHSSHGTRTTKKKFYLPPRFFFCRKFPLFWTGPSDNRKIPPLPTRFFPYKYLCKPPFCPDIAYLELFFFYPIFFFLPHHLILTPLPVFGSRLSPSLKKKI